MWRLPQFARDANAACACDGIKRLGCPTAGIHSTDGTLVFALYPPDIGRLREIVARVDRNGVAVVREPLAVADPVPGVCPGGIPPCSQTRAV